MNIQKTKFHEWQLDRMRRALRILEMQFQKLSDQVSDDDLAAGLDTKRKDNTWLDLAKEISNATGVDFDDGDRLRKFAKGEPNSKKPLGYAFPRMQYVRLCALKSYLQDPNTIEDRSCILPKIDLDTFEPNLQIPFYTLEYLRNGWPVNPKTNYKNFEGNYVARRVSDDILFLYHLTLESSSLDGALQATMFEEQSPIPRGYERNANNHWLFDLPTVPDEVIKSKGWAFITSDDQIFFLLKRIDDRIDLIVQNQLLNVIEANEGIENQEALVNFSVFNQLHLASIPTNRNHGDIVPKRENAPSSIIDNIIRFQRVR